MAHRVSIYGKDILIERGVNSDDITHLMVYLQLQGGHWSIKVNTVQVVHQQNLAVTFSTISWFRTFCGLPNLDDDHVSIEEIRVNECKRSKSKLTEQRGPRIRTNLNTPFRN